jgi:hypothetical protein
MSDILATGLAKLATTRGESLTYSATFSGTYAALTGWVLTIDRIPAPTFDDASQAGEVAETATLKGPLSPALQRGWFITDGNSNKWSIEGVKTEQQQVCTLMRTKVTKRAPDRGSFS